ncbi:hypothetical protein ACJX0J_025344, partial [Zea mays]
VHAIFLPTYIWCYSWLHGRRTLIINVNLLDPEQNLSGRPSRYFTNIYIDIICDSNVLMALKNLSLCLEFDQASLGEGYTRLELPEHTIIKSKPCYSKLEILNNYFPSIWQEAYNAF